MSTKSVSLIVIIAKVSILVAICFLLWDKLKMHEEELKNMHYLLFSSLADNWLDYLLVILLMFLNWFLEALKWKTLAGDTFKITFWQSLKGVMSGLTLAFVTPHGLGDYLGRTLNIQAKDRFTMVGAVFLGRAVQMMATATFGLVGLYYLFGAQWLVGGLLLLCFLSFIAYLLIVYLNSFSIISKYFGIILSYSRQILIRVIGLSFFRYVVFCSQFVIILYIFLPQLEIDLATAGATYIFLAKSIIPSFNFLSDLGIREYSAIHFFENFSVDIIPVLSASLTLWVINILIPTIIGIPFMLRLRLNNRKA